MQIIIEWVEKVSGYADLSGVDDNEIDIDIKKFKPFINFKWFNELIDVNILMLKDVDKNTKSYKIVLSYDDLDINTNQLIINCYNGKIDSVKDLDKIFNMGFRVIRLCDNIKITKHTAKYIDNSQLIIDVYGMNEKNYKKLCKYTTKPIFLSIGNSKTISTNKRNVDDSKIKAVRGLNGIVGINITKDHLSTSIGRYDSFEYIFRHIDYLIDLVGVDNLSFSAGFHANNILPWEVGKLGDIKVVENWLKVFYGEEVVEKIMWRNAYNFLMKSLKK